MVRFFGVNEDNKNNDEKVNLEYLNTGAYATGLIEGMRTHFVVRDDICLLQNIAEFAKKLKESLEDKEISYRDLNELSERFKENSEIIISSLKNDYDDDFPLEEYYEKIKNCDPYIQMVYFALTHPKIGEMMKNSEEKELRVRGNIKQYVFKKMNSLKEIMINLIDFLAELDKQEGENLLYQDIKNYKNIWKELNNGALEEFWDRLIKRVDKIPYNYYKFNVENDFFCVENKKKIPTFDEIKGYEEIKKKS